MTPPNVCPYCGGEDLRHPAHGDVAMDVCRGCGASGVDMAIEPLTDAAPVEVNVGGDGLAWFAQ